MAGTRGGGDATRKNTDDTSATANEHADGTTPSGRHLDAAGAEAFANELLARLKAWHTSRTNRDD